MPIARRPINEDVFSALVKIKFQVEICTRCLHEQTYSITDNLTNQKYQAETMGLVASSPALRQHGDMSDEDDDDAVVQFDFMNSIHETLGSNAKFGIVSYTNASIQKHFMDCHI